MSSQSVEFMVNCFERNIDEITSPGFLTRAVEQHLHAFAIRTLLINNVVDSKRAKILAQRCVERGEIDRYLFVDELRDKALRVTNLRQADFGRYLHWSDCCLTAIVAEGPDLLCYVDADLMLHRPYDWIAAGLEVMRDDRRVAVANPAWVMADEESSVATEADEAGSGYYLGYGFTDQAFLVRRTRFAVPLRRRWIPLWLDCPVSVRFPTAHSALVFEQVVDAFMRRNSLLRVTLIDATFEPIPFNHYPAISLVERFRARRNDVLIEMLRRAHRRRPGWIVSPRLRTAGLLRSASSGRGK